MTSTPLTDAITVEDLFKKLSFGPLSNLSMSNEGDGTIKEDSQGKIINYLNDGLLRLYSRYNLRERELMLRMMNGYTTYHLLQRFAESRCETDPPSTDPIFIMDALDPFQQDVIKVLVVRSMNGQDIPINDEEDPRSVFTPKHNIIQIPRPTGGHVLSVIYQAKHKKIEYGVLSATIYLPEVLHEALVSFIAGQVFSHMNSAESTAKGTEHLRKFEALCADVVEQDLVSTAISTSNTLFKKRGWV